MSMSSRADTRMKELAFSAMFAALALIFSYVEVLIPIPIPGVKLGVANLVIIIALYRMGFRRAFSINCARIVMAGLLFSGVFGMIYSFAGGILSLTVMYLLWIYQECKFKCISVKAVPLEHICLWYKEVTV